MRTIRVITVPLIREILITLAHLSVVAAAPVWQRDTSTPVDVIPSASGKTTLGLFWGAIGIIQILIATIVVYAEQGNMWTFRFRLARFEYIWWTVVSVLLCTSFGISVMSFLAGDLTDATSLLVIAAAAGAAIVSYTVPAWRSRHYVELRWLAWTGQCRSPIFKCDVKWCGDSKDWQTLQVSSTGESDKVVTASDNWGWWIYPWMPVGIPHDPFVILEHIHKTRTELFKVPKDEFHVYDEGLSDKNGERSLLWGKENGFRKRVMCSVMSIPIDLTKSRPLTTDGYNGEHLCLALGILERSKGPSPETLVFKMISRVCVQPSDVSGAPGVRSARRDHVGDCYSRRHRPGAYLLTYYMRTMKEHYEAVGTGDFISAAVELAIALTNSERSVVRKWLDKGLEQQNIELNIRLRELGVTSCELAVCYSASYASMIVSLMYREVEEEWVRPDLLCMALLLGATGAAKPGWWTEEFVRDRLKKEKESCGELGPPQPDF